MNAPTETRNLPALAVGGHVGAIVPQSFEEMWRVSQMAVHANIVPVALTGYPPKEEAPDAEWERWGKKATSAACAVMMSGAELGLPPMVALRSFTMIGNRPALYGDGLINVCRRSKKAEYIRTGFNENIGGWCEAKRIDNGEERRVEFSVDDAKRAGLWDDRPTKRGKVWREGKQIWVDDAPNDSPWYRYPKRMLAWRAAGYCLRELFADVLGGITDEFEAREIAGFDGDRAAPEPVKAVTAPPPPAEEQVTAPEPVEESEPEQSPDEVVAHARQMAMNCQTAEDLETLLDYFGPDLDAMDDDTRSKVEAILNETRDRIEPNVLGAG